MDLGPIIGICILLAFFLFLVIIFCIRIVPQ